MVPASDSFPTSSPHAHKDDGLHVIESCAGNVTFPSVSTVHIGSWILSLSII